MRTIFVVDEENISFIIRQYLVREGFRVETFSSMEELLMRLEAVFPDMFILDILLASTNNLEFCKDLERRSGLPVLFTTGSRAEVDLIAPLEMDAYEYLTKPFSPLELIAHVRSIFRRSALPVISEEILEIGNLRVNPNDRRTTADAIEVMLTPQEYELLLLLAEHPQRTFIRQELLDRVWGCDYVGEVRAVDNLVRRLRKKLRESGSSKHVRTIWGCGYRFED
jgi:DNA-binding response OmpR family regulator